MKFKKLMCASLAGLFTFGVQVPVFASNGLQEFEMNEVVEMNTPYVLASTMEQIESVLARRNDEVIVTNIEVADILNGSAKGIIITEQDLEEAVAVLNEAYLNSDRVIPNLVTMSIRFSENTEPIVMESSEVERGTSAPTQIVPMQGYQANWSGTTNDTYTNYYAPANSGFITTSTQSPTM